MRLLALLFIVVGVLSVEIVTDFDTHIYHAEASEIQKIFWHFDRDGLIYTVKNPDDFPLQDGYSRISYNVTRYDVYLTSYTRLTTDPRRPSKLMDNPSPVNGCPYYNSKLKIAMIRCQRWGKDTCITMTTATEYFNMIDHWLRLMTNDRVSVDYETSYITTTCCAVSSEIYQSASHGDLMNSAIQDCKQINPRVDESYSSRIFVSDGNFDWAGLGVVGSAIAVRDRYNYWAIMRYSDDPQPGKYHYTGGVIIHEFGHNMGFNHAGFVASMPDFFIPTYYSPNNYGDGASVMGTGSSWFTPPGPYHYFRIVSQGQPEPHWTAKVQDGLTKYRLFAWDDPYSRPFLGGDTARLNEEEMIYGIPFKNNIMIIEIPYNREDMCSTIEEKYTYGSFTLEYRLNGGFYSFGKYSLRLTNYRVDGQGYSTGVSILLDAQIDRMTATWQDSSIPFGVYFVPPELDRGFISIHITKVHRELQQIAYEQLEQGVQPLENIAYIEFEVSYRANHPYLPVPVPSGLSEYEFSANVYGCTRKADVSGFDCKIMGTRLYYAYIPPYGYRGHPRVYYLNGGTAFGQSVPNVVSINGNTLMNYYIGFGDFARFTLRVDVEYVNGPSFRLNTWLKTRRSERPITGTDDQYQLTGTGNYILADNIPFTENTRLVFDDLFGNAVEIPQDAAFITQVPTLKVPGAAECTLKVYEGDELVSYKVTNIRNMESNTRIAVISMTEKNIQISHASIPSGYFTLPTTYITPRRLAANKWYPAPVTRMGTGDWFYIDFDGCLPEDVTMYLDTDVDIYPVYLGRFENWCDFSLRFTFKDMHERGSPNGNIGGIMFNKEVGFLGIRPCYVSKTGDYLPNQNVGTDYYNMNDVRNRFDFDEVPNSFTFTPFEVAVLGKAYVFNDFETVYTLNVAEVGYFNWGIVWGIVGGILGIIVLLGLICFMKTICVRSPSKTAPLKYVLFSRLLSLVLSPPCQPTFLLSLRPLLMDLLRPLPLLMFLPSQRTCLLPQESLLLLLLLHLLRQSLPSTTLLPPSLPSPLADLLLPFPRIIEDKYDSE